MQTDDGVQELSLLKTMFLLHPERNLEFAADDASLKAQLGPMMKRIEGLIGSYGQTAAEQTVPMTMPAAFKDDAFFFAFNEEVPLAFADASCLVRYFRKEAGPNQLLQPAGAKGANYAEIKMKELPYYASPLQNATGAEIEQALRRIGSTIAIGSRFQIGGIVTNPGHCSANFDELPVLDSVDELTAVTKLVQDIDATGACFASSASFVFDIEGSDDHPRGNGASMAKVQPVRVTVGAYKAFLTSHLEAWAAKASENGGAALAEASLVSQQETESLLQTITEAAESGAVADTTVLRLFAYANFSPKKTKEVTKALYPHTFTPLTKPHNDELEQQKRISNMQFIEKAHNFTRLEIVAQSTEGEYYRFLVTVPILPKDSWDVFRDEYPAAYEIAKDPSWKPQRATAGEKRPTPPASVAESVEGGGGSGDIEAAPTKKDISAATKTTTENKVKEKKKNKDAAAVLDALNEPASVAEEAATENGDETEKSTPKRKKKQLLTVDERVSAGPTLEEVPKFAYSPEEAFLLGKVVECGKMIVAKGSRNETLKQFVVPEDGKLGPEMRAIIVTTCETLVKIDQMTVIEREYNNYKQHREAAEAALVEEAKRAEAERLQKEEEERLKKEAEEAARKKKEAEEAARKKKEAEEAARKKKEAEEAAAALKAKQEAEKKAAAAAAAAAAKKAVGSPPKTPPANAKKSLTFADPVVQSKEPVTIDVDEDEWGY